MIGLDIVAQISTSSLPIVIITSEEGHIPDEPKVDGLMRIISAPDNSLNSIWDPADDYEGEIAIERRGSSSQEFYPKNQFGLETRFPDGENRNVSLLGMPSENDWILHTSPIDRTLLRNVLGQELYRAMGHYAPRMRAVELWIDGSYEGVYHLTERIKRDVARVDLNEMEGPDDIMGGFLLKYDRPSLGCEPLPAMGERYVETVYPDCASISNTQDAFIRTQFAELEHRIEEGAEVWEHLDLNATVDYFLFTEFSKNTDAYGLSTFFHYSGLADDAKFYFGPPWDMDLAFGLAHYRNSHTISGWRAENDAGLWRHLFQDSLFQSTANARWRELRASDGLWADESLMALIDSLVEDLGTGAEQNFQRWDDLGRRYGPNYHIGFDHDGELRYLKSWMLARAHWMDTYFGMEPGRFMTAEERSRVYPNPFFHFLQIEALLPEDGEVRYEIYDLEGKCAVKQDFGKTEAGYHRWLVDQDALGTHLDGRNFILLLYINDKLIDQHRLFRYGQG